MNSKYQSYKVTVLVCYEINKKGIIYENTGARLLELCTIRFFFIGFLWIRNIHLFVVTFTIRSYTWLKRHIYCSLLRAVPTQYLLHLSTYLKISLSMISPIFIKHDGLLIFSSIIYHLNQGGSDYNTTCLR